MQNENLVAILDGGGPVFIDGGLATQLEAQGCDLNNNLWSAAMLMSNQGAIVDAHRAYLDAGAQIIITASYQASRKGFEAKGLSTDEADKLIVRSVSLAAQARDEYLADNPDSKMVPLIAASIGPYGAALHDGSEYTGDYGVPASELRDFHSGRLSLLDGTDADLLACETIPSMVEAEVLCELLNNATSPAWVSFSCRDEEHISDGNLLRDAAAMFRNHPRVFAVGINCTPPQYVLPLIGTIRFAAQDKLIVVYPNSGEIYHSEDNTWSGTVTADDWAAAAGAWRRAGARLIGGCCRTGPSQIAAIVANV